MRLLTCTRCRSSKPETPEYFPLHNRKRNGLDSWCRVCRASYRNEICRGRFRTAISDDELKKLKANTKFCEICGSKEKLVVDHDHSSGLVRGMLCNYCNRGLGHFRDDLARLEKAKQYLLTKSSGLTELCLGKQL